MAPLQNPTMHRGAFEFPPGPPRSLRTLTIYGPGRDPLVFFSNLARTYGDISHVHTADEHLFLLNHPQLVKDVLVQNVRAGRSVVMTTHILEIAERMADRIGVISGGKLVAEGTLDEFRSRFGTARASLEDMFLAIVQQDRALA